MNGDQVKGFFSRFAPRDIMEIIVVVGLGVGFLLTRETNVANIQTGLSDLTRSFNAFSIEIKAMNEQGTVGSRLAIQMLKDRGDRNEERITRLEVSMNQINEKFTDVQAKLTTIAVLLQGGQKKPRAP